MGLILLQFFDAATAGSLDIIYFNLEVFDGLKWLKLLLRYAI